MTATVLIQYLHFLHKKKQKTMKPLWALGTTQLFRYILCFLQVSHDFKSFT